MIMCAVWLGVSGGPASAAGTSSWEETAAQWLDAEFHQPGGRWSATVLASPPGWEFMPGEPGASIEGVARGVRQAKKIMVLTVVHPQTRARGELKIQTVCLVKVPVANHLLARGQAISASDWHWEERDRAVLPADALKLEQDLEHKRVKKYLGAKEVISAHALEPLPEVFRGQRLTLRVKGSGVTVTADAEAEEEGRVGEVIKVKISASGKMVTASVAGAEAADLVLPPRGAQP